MASSPTIPAVLVQPAGNSLSTERVLKMARALLLQATFDTEDEDRQCIVCMEDLDDLIKAIDRS